MKTLKYIIVLAFLFSGTNLYAQKKMTLQQCRKMALQKNEDLKMADRQLEKARTEKDAAKTLRLPKFSATGTGIYINQDFEQELTLPTKKPNQQTGELEPNIMINPATGEPVIGPDGNPVFNMYAFLPLSVSLKGTYLAGVTMEQPIYTGGKINAGNEMAKIGVEMAGENIELQQMNTLVEADKVYWNYVSVNQKVKLAQEAVDLLGEIVEDVRNSYEVGMIHKNDLLKAQVEYNNATLDLHKAKNGHELIRMNLCRITGLPLNTQVVALDTLINVEPILMNDSSAVISERPEYQLLEKNIHLQEENIKMTRADFLPTAGIQAGYSYLGGLEFGNESYSNSGLNVMASLKIPIFHWGEGAKKIDAAKIDKEISTLKLEKNRQLLQLEVEQARLNLNLAYERIQMSETALEQAEENLRITRDNYEVGMEKLTDLLKAQTQWQEAHSNLIDAKTDYKIKKTNWLKVTGRLGADVSTTQ
ncbi:MAG TPA: TolC family protein [Tangfeifania sp.]|nr:TolC family protein [Tangfeifania sp.]